MRYRVLLQVAVRMCAQAGTAAQPDAANSMSVLLECMKCQSCQYLVIVLTMVLANNALVRHMC